MQRSEESTDPEPPRRRNWLARRFAAVAYHAQEPRRIVPTLRRSAARLWASHGGGFYGLGYVLTFIVLEVRLFVEEVAGADNIATFLASELLTIIFRLGVASFVNGLIALGWPILWLDAIGGWGFLAIGVFYLLYAFALRPTIELWYPELGQMRAERQANRRTGWFRSRKRHNSAHKRRKN